MTDLRLNWHPERGEDGTQTGNHEADLDPRGTTTAVYDPNNHRVTVYHDGTPLGTRFVHVGGLVSAEQHIQTLLLNLSRTVTGALRFFLLGEE